MSSQPSRSSEAARPGTIGWQTGVLFAVWAVPAVFMVLQMYATAVVNRTPLPPPRALVPAIAEWLVWVPLTPLIIRLARRFRIGWPPSPIAIAVHALGIGGATLLRGTVYASATFLVGRVAADVTFLGYLGRIALAWLPIAAVVYGAIVAAGAAVDYARRLRAREVRDAELREQLTRAELNALRARVHPHFLFNALHSIGALVRGGQHAAAVGVVAELSELLREALSRDAPELVPLRDELTFVRRYLEIERVRFADRLSVEWDIAKEAHDAVVPSLIVQPLVENAMRHAISKSWAAGRLRITARREGAVLAIEVSDDGPGPTRAPRDGNGRAGLPPHATPARVHDGGAGVGLADARARLARLYGDDGSLTLRRGELGGATARVRLPFVTSAVGDR